ARNGKGISHGWSFLTSYNSEEAHTLLEVNASKKDKDLMAVINWKKAEEYLKSGKARDQVVEYCHNIVDEGSGIASTKIEKNTKVLDPTQLKDFVYFIPVPKSPHGCDVSPTGEYIVGNGKLSADQSVYSFTKIKKAIDEKKFSGDI